MDFFSRKDDAEARSQTFYRAFGLAVALAVVVFYFVVTLVLAMIFGQLSGLAQHGLVEGLIDGLPRSIYGSPPQVLALRPFLIVSAMITALILVAGWLKTRAIKLGGGAYIAEAMGGQEILDPKNAKEKRLLNVIEEMAVAAGLPRPRVYLMPREMTINAVTAGLDHDDAVIAVTQGSLNLLDRDELQGVVAHEFAHILNGDCALNLRMAGWLYGLLFFYVQGRDMMNVAADMEWANDQGQTSIMSYFAVVLIVIGLVLRVGGWLGKLAAEILQAAFSRQREHLADAFAVQFTRSPQGLAGALKKIAGLPRGGTMRNAQSLMMNSFFIVSPERSNGSFKEFLEGAGLTKAADRMKPVSTSRASLWQSHPPLEDRIWALEPQWDGMVAEIDPAQLASPADLGLKLRQPERLEHLVPQSAKKLLDKMDHAMPGGSEALLLALVAAGGGPRPATGFWSANSLEAEAAGRSLAQARTMFSEIPDELRSAVDDPVRVGALTAAVFLHDEGEAAQAQRKYLEEHLGQEVAEQATAFRARLDERMRLPVLGLASPTLKRLGPAERQKITQAVKALVAADGKFDLFEVAACQLLKKPLGTGFVNSGGGCTGANYLTRLQENVVTVLSALAHVGAGDDAEEARKAFAVGIAHFTQWPVYDILPPGSVRSAELARALDQLGEVPEKVRHQLILASVSTALFNHQVSEKEYQVLRALAAAVDVPMPLLDLDRPGG